LNISSGPTPALEAVAKDFLGSALGESPLLEPPPLFFFGRGYILGSPYSDLSIPERTLGSNYFEKPAILPLAEEYRDQREKYLGSSISPP